MGQSKVTLTMVEELIKAKQFSRVSPKTTVCILTLANGMEVIGWATRQNHTEHHQATAENAAYAKALDAVWPLAVCYYGAIGV